MGHDDDIDDGLAEVKAILGRLQRISRSPGNDVVGPPLQPGPPEPFKDGPSPPVSGFRLVNALVLVVPLVALTAGAVLIIKDFNGRGDAAVDHPGGEDAPAADARRQDLPEGGTAAVPATAAPEAVSDPADAQSGGLPPGGSQSGGSGSGGSQSGSSQSGSSRAGESEAGKSVTLADRSLLPSSPARYASDLLASGQVQAARTALLGVAAADSADVAFALARSYDPRYLATLASADAAPDVAEAKRWYRVWYDIAVRQGLVSDSVPLERIIRSMD